MSGPTTSRTITVEPEWEGMCEWFARALAEHAFDRFATDPVISLIEQVRYLTQTDTNAVARIIDSLAGTSTAVSLAKRGV